MYKISKDTFQIVVKKETRGIKLTLSRANANEKKYFSVISKGNVFLYDKEWVLLDTSTLKNDKEDVFENAVSNLVQVILLYKVDGKRLELNFDEILFLEALIHDLYSKSIDWLPYGNDYEFKDNLLISHHEEWTYEYEMPIKQGFTKEDFTTKQITHPIPLVDDDITTEEE